MPKRKKSKQAVPENEIGKKYYSDMEYISWLFRIPENQIIKIAPHELDKFFTVFNN